MNPLATPGARFCELLRVENFRDATAHASALFRDCFNSDFPTPSDGVLPVSTPAANWQQDVAFYQWPGGPREAVGFVNWIRVGDFHLCGGMCVQKTFYRRLPREHFRACSERGGVAQILLQSGWARFDTKAVFGYCGDAKARVVDLRAGFVQTRYDKLLVKWLREPPEPERGAMIDRAAAIGPF